MIHQMLHNLEMQRRLAQHEQAATAAAAEGDGTRLAARQRATATARRILEPAPLASETVVSTLDLAASDAAESVLVAPLAPCLLPACSLAATSGEFSRWPGARSHLMRVLPPVALVSSRPHVLSLRRRLMSPFQRECKSKRQKAKSSLGSTRTNPAWNSLA